MSSRGRLLVTCAVTATVLVSVPAASQTVYIAFGDSITFGTFESPYDGGYPRKLERLLDDAGQPAAVENFGQPGEKTTEGVTRIDSALAGGDVLLLMEGTNDIHAGISLETTATNLATMAQKAANRGLSTVHGTLIPRSPRANVDPGNHLNRQLAQLIRDLAADRGRRLADPFIVFLMQPDYFNTYYYQGSDPVGHPNGDGYQLLAEIFADVLQERDTVPPVETFVQPPDGAVDVPATTGLRVELIDFGNGIDTATAELLLDGDPIPTNVQVSGNRVTLRNSPQEPLLGVYELSYRAADLATPSNSVTQEVSEFTIEGTTFLRGDLDKDGRVDGQDLVFLGWRFGGRRGADSRYFVGFDLNGDGVLDGDDVAILAQNFGKTSF